MFRITLLLLLPFVFACVVEQENYSDTLSDNVCSQFVTECGGDDVYVYCIEELSSSLFANLDYDIRRIESKVECSEYSQRRMNECLAAFNEGVTQLIESNECRHRLDRIDEYVPTPPEVCSYVYICNIDVNEMYENCSA